MLRKINIEDGTAFSVSTTNTLMRADQCLPWQLGRQLGQAIHPGQMLYEVQRVIPLVLLLLMHALCTHRYIYHYPSLPIYAFHDYL